MTRARRAGVLLWVAAVAAAGAALAGDAPRSAPVALEARGGRLVAAVDVAPAFPADLRRQLSNGLTNVVALHVALLPAGGDQTPVALSGREIDVLYDVWDETYGVTVKDAAAPRGRTRVLRTWDELRAYLGLARDVDLGPAAELGGGAWVVQTRVELNPVSKELLERTREFIANPAAAGRVGTPSRSVLGTMASYLLRSADPGAVVHVFRSAPFTAREVPHR